MLSVFFNSDIILLNSTERIMINKATNMQRDILVLNLKKELKDFLKQKYDTTLAECTNEELYYTLLALCKKFLAVTERNTGEKKVYYISAEYMIGRLLTNNLVNMGIYDRVEEILQIEGRSLEDLEDLEKESALGSGALGRLAACFIDMMATEGIPAEALGLNYHYGLFRQVLQDHLQKAEKDDWLEDESWENATAVSFEVSFGRQKVRSQMYNIDVVGYNNGVDELRLFDLATVDPSIVGDGISFDKKDIERNLTLFVYPDDSDEDGRKLRLYQQYFLASNAVQWILREMKARQYDLWELYEHVVIQINDTHSSLIIPELIRILTQEKAINFDKAVEIVRKTCAYTNHTIQAEALEVWPVSWLEEVAPQLMPVIREMDRRIWEKYQNQELQILNGNIIRMASMDIHYCFSVNGVSQVHTGILKESVFPEFYRIYPAKFNNKTDGVSHKRWMVQNNRELTKYLSQLIGDAFKKDTVRLEKLLDFREDPKVLAELEDIRRRHKQELAEKALRKWNGRLDPSGIYDVQAKIIHEYKRQQMNCLYIIRKCLEIRRGILPARPINFIFAGKASTAYREAENIIHLILVLQELINSDPDIRSWLHILMIPDYNVSIGMELVKAADISEQIALGSREASGTGNLKMMMNGALTIGAVDGTNKEILGLVGEDNFYAFGMLPQQALEHWNNQDYSGWELYNSDPEIRETVDFICSEEMLRIGSRDRLLQLRELFMKDQYMSLLDLKDYIRVKDRMLLDYEDRAAWNRKMLVNIAYSGHFSAGRMVQEYNRDIWRI